MNLGYNQNVTYNGEVYHVQTEDGGKTNPVITTLLFKGGVILASKRTNYADILSVENLESIVNDIMREQHAAILHDLKAGLFDILPQKKAEVVK